jgi:hypothetical protein
MLPEEGFYRDNAKKSGLSSQCKECTRDRLRVRFPGPRYRIYANETILLRWLRDEYRLPKDMKINVRRLLGVTTAEARAPYPSPYEIRRSEEQVESGIEELWEQYEHDKLGIIRGDFEIEE